VTRSARKALIWLVTIVVGFSAILASGVATGKTDVTPGLALDLAGGRQIILEAVTENNEVITQTDLEQAVAIIRQRVDGTGVAEAEISTQGDTIIVVGLPGNPSERIVELVSQSAQLQFRPVILSTPNTGPIEEPVPDASPSPAVSPSPEAATTPSPEASPMSKTVTGVAIDTDDSTPAPTVDEPAAPDAAVGDELPDTLGVAPDPETTDPSSLDWLNTPGLYEDFLALDCTDPANRSGVSMGDPNAAYVACHVDGIEKYVLGPVELDGSDIDTANAGPEVDQFGNPIGGFATNIDFTGDGGKKFDAVAARLYDLEGDQNRFGMVLDGGVISAPSVSTRNYAGRAQITGGMPAFTQEEAELLANQLKFGALPMSLDVLQNEQISATLGTDSLQKGLLAGLIGLVLVFVYSLIQYRALGLVTVASLLIAGLTTFLLISLLSWGMGYRLSLAGVAGLIVAIGITADSFIVLFERVRDELRDGRSLQSAIDHAWRRARRTILASDVISLLAAVTLYMLAVGGVRGFAFTLGLVTLVDVLVVFLFTHPMLVLLARTKFFGDGDPLSGFDPRQLGRESLYKGRGRVAVASAPVPASTASTMTLAERKAAAAKGEQ
jgi:preprotein translocase subunit SecD